MPSTWRQSCAGIVAAASAAIAPRRDIARVGVIATLEHARRGVGRGSAARSVRYHAPPPRSTAETPHASFARSARRLLLALRPRPRAGLSRCRHLLAARLAAG